jgi:AraC-like DNA-binding protein
MEIKFQQIQPLPPLSGHVEKMWVLESDAPMPQDDMKLVVPNGRLLLVVPFRNGILGKMNAHSYMARNNRISIIGMSDHPAVVDATQYGPTGTIGVEISASAAYRFFNIRMKDIAEQSFHLADILGNATREIEERMEACTNIHEKVALLQNYLLSLFLTSKEDSIFEFCSRQVLASKGCLRIKELEQRMGYSSRWLRMKFEERLGMSPKNLLSVIRFQQYYQDLLVRGTDVFRQKRFYDHYHDESHFIREFKRFTGMSPSRLIRGQNEYGKTLYQD